MTVTSPAMIKWQLDRLMGQLILLADHYADPTCPCTFGYTDPSGTYVGENCVAKHLLAIYEYATETQVMAGNDEELRDKLLTIADEARQLREKEKEKLCGKEIESADLAEWARGWRKAIEERALACELVEGGKNGTGTGSSEIGIQQWDLQAAQGQSGAEEVRRISEECLLPSPQSRDESRLGQPQMGGRESGAIEWHIPEEAISEDPRRPSFAQVRRIYRDVFYKKGIFDEGEILAKTLQKILEGYGDLEEASEFAQTLKRTGNSVFTARGVEISGRALEEAINIAKACATGIAAESSIEWHIPEEVNESSKTETKIEWHTPKTNKISPHSFEWFTAPIDADRDWDEWWKIYKETGCII